MNFAMVRKSFLAFDKVSELDQMGILYQTESFLTACISLVHKLDKPWSRQWPSFTNTRKELIEMCSPIGHNSTKHFLCPIRSRLRLNFWKWSGDNRYPGALSPVMKTFVPPFLPTRLPLGLRGWMISRSLLCDAFLYEVEFSPVAICIFEFTRYKKGSVGLNDFYLMMQNVACSDYFLSSG